MQITVANYTLSLCFDSESCSSGTLVRHPDGVEASFSSPDCLLYLLEGIFGRRAWHTYRDQIVDQLPCLRYAS